MNIFIRIFVMLTLSVLPFGLCFSEDHHHQEEDYHEAGDHDNNGGGNNGGGNNGGSTPECSSVFSHALQAHGASNSYNIDFSCGATTTNNPTTTLPARNVDYSSGCANTCVTAHCSDTGSPAPTMDAGTFQSRSGGSSVTVTSGNSQTIGQGGTQNYRDLVVRSGGTLTFSAHAGSTVYKMRDLTVRSGATVNLPAGDYWIESASFESQATFNIIGSGTVRLFFKNYTTIQSGVSFNSTESNPSKQLLLYGYKGIIIDSNVTLNAFVYTQRNITVRSGAVIVGAMSGRDINLASNAQATYDSVAAGLIDLGNMCQQSTSDVTHFVINTANVGTICQPHEVTVTAKDSSGTVTDYSGAITLDSGQGVGTWTKVQGNGTFTDTNTSDGIATYTFAESDNGVAIFSLYYAGSVSPINIETYETSNTSIRDDDTEGTVNFNTLSLVLTENEVTNNNMSPFTATMTAGVEDTVHITAYGGTGDSCGVVTDFTGDKNLNLWFDYVNPNQGTLPIILRPDLATNSTGNLNSSEASSTTHTVEFTSGKAEVGIKYRDVGSLKLHAKDQSNNDVRGSTGSFVVKPARISLSIPNNPSANDASGGVFKKAGEAFTVVSTVQDIDGNTTPNYGNESSPEGITVYSSTLVAPQNGRNGAANNGVLGNGSAFSKTAPGVFTGTTLSFDEVGIIKLTGRVASSNYLGVGNVSGPESVNVGRFIPNSFTVSANTPSFNSGCISCGFTYIGQMFRYNVGPQLTITARSLNGSTTSNYDGSFFKLSAPTISVAYSSNSTQAILNAALAETDINLSNQGAGVALLALGDGGGISYLKAIGVNANPFNAEVSVSTTILDADNVAYADNPYTIGGTTAGAGIIFNGAKQFYQGRVSLKNANGSDLIALSVPFYVEYFNGTDYIVNTLDSVSQVSVGDVSTTVDPSNLNTTASIQNQISGTGSIILSAPNPSMQGFVDIVLDLSNLLYLQHDWPHDGNSDGLFNDNPRARASFGTYSGDPNVIYMRELY